MIRLVSLCLAGSLLQACGTSAPVVPPLIPDASSNPDASSFCAPVPPAPQDAGPPPQAPDGSIVPLTMEVTSPPNDLWVGLPGFLVNGADGGPPIVEYAGPTLAHDTVDAGPGGVTTFLTFATPANQVSLLPLAAAFRFGGSTVVNEGVTVGALTQVLGVAPADLSALQISVIERPPPSPEFLVTGFEASLPDGGSVQSTGNPAMPPPTPFELAEPDVVPLYVFVHTPDASTLPVAGGNPLVTWQVMSNADGSADWLWKSHASRAAMAAGSDLVSLIVQEADGTVEPVQKYPVGSIIQSAGVCLSDISWVELNAVLVPATSSVSTMWSILEKDGTVVTYPP